MTVISGSSRARCLLTLALAAACGGSTRPAAQSPAPAPPTASSPSLVDDTDSIALRIDRYLGRLEALGFSGAIVVEHDGRLVLRKGYGLADREARRVYSPRTVQSMGSITKPVTAAAILLLEERGLLRTSDSLPKYFPDVPADKRAITLHHLLTHQSGLPEAIGRDAEAIDAPTLVARAMQTPLEFEPGDGAGYSNTGFSLLGIIVERVSGRGYEQFLRDELLSPAGLGSTGYVLPTWPEEVIASGYRSGELFARDDRANWLADGPGWHLRANGGLRTTVDDMHRWLGVLRGTGPLSETLVARWTDRHLVLNDELALGYGWNVYTTDFGRLIGHVGGNPGFASAFGWMPERRFFYYVQGNTSYWPAEALEAPLLRVAFDSTFVMPPLVSAARDSDPAATAARAGEYVADGGRLRLRTDDVRLLATMSGQPMLDAVLGHPAVERERFARVNDRAAQVVGRLGEGREDALDGVQEAGTDAAERARRLLALLSRDAKPQSFAVVGTLANVPETRFASQGGLTTLVRVEYEGGARILNLLWREDGTYRGGAMGPLSDVPAFMLVPEGDGAYVGVERSAPWRVQRFRFEGVCVVVGEVRACRDGDG